MPPKLSNIINIFLPKVHGEYKRAFVKKLDAESHVALEILKVLRRKNVIDDYMNVMEYMAKMQLEIPNKTI